MGGATLVTVRPGVTLEQSAAASFVRVESVAGRIDVNSSYRDWDEQYQLWLAYKNGSGVLALHPDKSMHCKGLAIDTSSVSVMRAVEAYGWRSTVPTEDWHFDYFPNLDQHYGETPSPATTKGRKVTIVFRKASNGQILAVPEGGPYKEITSESERNRFADSVDQVNAFIARNGGTQLNPVPTWAQLASGELDLRDDDADRLIEYQGSYAP